jgi:hypothetical protein
MERQALRRTLRWPLWTLLGLGVLLAVFATALAIGSHHLEEPLLRALTARTGREIQVEGTFAARLLSLHPQLTATEVSIGNPPWMPPGTLAHIGRLSLDLDWQLAMPPVRIRRLEMEHAVLHLLRDAAGRTNWHLQETGAGKGAPLIASLSVPDAHVDLHDERRHLEFRGIVSAGDAGAGPAPPLLRIEGAGQLNGRAATFSLDGDALAQARRDQPYHFRLKEHSGATHLSGGGFLQQPFDFRDLHGSFTAAGPDMKDLYFLVGLSLPDTGPFHLSGKLTRQGKRFVYSDLAVSSGKSDLGGTLSVDSSGGRSRIEADLSSGWLRLADIGARAAGREPEAPSTPELRVPDTPLRLGGLHRSDWRIRYRARTVELADQTLERLSALVSVDRGVLSVERFDTSLAQGTLSGSARLDARGEVPRGELELLAAQVELDQLKSASGHEPPLGGALSGRVHLSGVGKSLHELAATANGTLTAVVPHGVMRASIAQLTSLNLSGALGVALKHAAQTEIRCGVASLEARDGVASVHSFVLDTHDALLTGSGSINMDSETLDLTLRGLPKKPALVLRSAVSVKGTLAHPQARLVGHDLLVQAGTAVALAVVLTPVAAVLAFVSPGLTHDADCASLVAQAKAAPEARAPLK